MWVLIGLFFHVLQLLPIKAAQGNLCCNSKSTKKKKTKKKEIRLEDRTSYGLGMVIERAHILIP
jgi:hypothetical protein